MKAFLVTCGLDDDGHVRNVMELSGIEVEAEFPDARSAIDSTRLLQGEERLCVIHVPGSEEVRQLKWLSEHFVGRPLMALVNKTSSSQHLFATNRAGAGQILPMPLQLEDFQASLACIKAAHSSPLSVAARRVIAVSGVTGGCGATTIAVNLAFEIADQFNLSCILIDLAHGGMVATYLDVEPRHTIADLLCDMGSMDIKFLERTLRPVTDNFRILPGANLEAERLPTSVDSILRLLDLVKQLADVVVIDLPIFHTDTRLGVFSEINQVLLVAEQTVPSLRALSSARNLFGQQEDGLTGQSLVINRYDTKKEGFGVGHLQRLLQTPQLITISNDYQGVSLAINEGQPLRRKAPRSTVVADLNKLTRMLVSPGSAAAPPPPAKLSRLRRLVHSIFGIANL